ncbi:uncharacterized protein LOC135371802 isoform X2 [Ornithodoros turicata]|uniref:uncharacterized protein LOC135371802 isoform X2 n=1 Tax=Ornithodoros turicata TaxID=34597 RepID=UPI003138A585
MNRGQHFARNHLLTIAVVGESGVGKTTFISTLARGTHGSTEDTMMGSFINQKTVEFAELKIHFWDVSWSFRDGRSTHLNLDEANAVILMYEIRRWSSFATLVNAVCLFEARASRILAIIFCLCLHMPPSAHHVTLNVTLPATRLPMEDIRGKCIMLVGGKLDCGGPAERKVSRRNGETLAKELDAIFFEVNAHCRTDVKGALETLTNRMLYGERRPVPGGTSAIVSGNAQMVSTAVVQLSLTGPNPQTRCLTTDLQTLTSLTIIREHIGRLFPSVLGRNFTLTYQGRGGESMVISSDAELSAVHANLDDNCLRLNISLLEETEEQPSSRRGVLHPNILCDMCEKDLYGVRYKCMECEDYDMCEPCYAKKTHTHHDILKLVRPADTSFGPIVLISDPEFLETAAMSDSLTLHVLAVESEKLKPLGTRTHDGIICDMCNETPVRGTRYKCLQCEDYDTCETCYEKKTHEEHDMLKLVNPRVAPCVLGLREIRP